MKAVSGLESGFSSGLNDRSGGSHGQRTWASSPGFGIIPSICDQWLPWVVQVCQSLRSL